MNTGAAFLRTLGLILAGPLLALLMGLFGLVLAPPNQGFSSLGYFPICGLALPIGVALFVRSRLLGWKFWSGIVVATFIAILLFLTTLSALSTLPGGMSTCNLIDSTNATVKYSCVDSSSDDPTYHREFMIVGFKGWVIMRAINL